MDSPSAAAVCSSCDVRGEFETVGLTAMKSLIPEVLSVELHLYMCAC